MEQLEIILSFVATALGLLAATATFILKSIKSERAKLNAENEMKVEDALLEFITQAEKLTGKGGVEKKFFALEKTAEFAKENEIEINKAHVSREIDRLVCFSKKVNKRRKDASAAANETADEIKAGEITEEVKE